ncbi:hypothetical protein B0H10DRAFT_1949644 [Mycena sp. CBHHK59/15]|nr:hypothetical protein B0H10DRAFT_1949644 [Mycena sp. CBHHK59/15]
MKRDGYSMDEPVYAAPVTVSLRVNRYRGIVLRCWASARICRAAHALTLVVRIMKIMRLYEDRTEQKNCSWKLTKNTLDNLKREIIPDPHKYGGNRWYRQDPSCQVLSLKSFQTGWPMAYQEYTIIVTPVGVLQMGASPTPSIDSSPDACSLFPLHALPAVPSVKTELHADHQQAMVKIPSLAITISGGKKELENYARTNFGTSNYRLVTNPSDASMGGTLVGASGVVTIKYTSGFSSTAGYSCTKSASLSVGVTAGASFGVPGVGDASVELFSTTTSNQIEDFVALDAPAGQNCRLTSKTWRGPFTKTVAEEFHKRLDGDPKTKAVDKTLSYVWLSVSSRAIFRALSPRSRV